MMKKYLILFLTVFIWSKSNCFAYTINYDAFVGYYEKNIKRLNNIKYLATKLAEHDAIQKKFGETYYLPEDIENALANVPKYRAISLIIDSSQNAIKQLNYRPSNEPSIFMGIKENLIVSVVVATITKEFIQNNQEATLEEICKTSVGRVVAFEGHFNTFVGNLMTNSLSPEVSKKYTIDEQVDFHDVLEGIQEAKNILFCEDEEKKLSVSLCDEFNQLLNELEN